jgi:hypothetical protein
MHPTAKTLFTRGCHPYRADFYYVCNGDTYNVKRKNWKSSVRHFLKLPPLFFSLALSQATVFINVNKSRIVHNQISFRARARARDINRTIESSSSKTPGSKRNIWKNCERTNALTIVAAIRTPGKHGTSCLRNGIDWPVEYIPN